MYDIVSPLGSALEVLYRRSLGPFHGWVGGEGLTGHLKAAFVKQAQCSFSNYYFFLAVLVLHCWVGAFSGRGEQGHSPVAVGKLLIEVASLVVEHGLSSCHPPAQLPHNMWNLPGPGIEPVSPALAGRFLTTGPPGESPLLLKGMLI